MTAPIEASESRPSVAPLLVPKELWFASALSLVLAYFLFSENGALLAENWVMLHEFFHDGRHLFGVPCH